MDDNSFLLEQYNKVLIAEQERQKMRLIDKLQLALDIIGFEPSYGTAADAVNVIISSLRAAAALAKRNNDMAKLHIINAGISAISLIPFADIIKLLKLKRLGTPAVKLGLHGARAAKTAGKAMKTRRIAKMQQFDNALEQDKDTEYR